jgi:hypothetical protein
MYFSFLIDPQLGSLVVETLALTLSNNKTLVQLDLSSNNFDPQDIETLKIGLEGNQSILQLRFDDNIASLNSKGFMGLKSVTVPSRSVKWIDDGWNEEVFRIKIDKDVLGLSKDEGIGPDTERGSPKVVCIHMSFEGWKADKMKMWSPNPETSDDGGDLTFIIHRVCPPGKLWFYFSVGGHLIIVDPHLPTIPRREYTYFGESGKLPRDCLQLNAYSVSKRCGPLVLQQEVPRRPWCELNLEETSRRPTWTVENSVFQGRKNNSPQGSFWDSEEVLQSSFNADWVHAEKKLQRIKVLENSENMDRVKETLQSFYPQIREIFR